MKLSMLVRAPFRVTGTALPPNILLLAKIIVVALVAKDYHFGFPDVFAPFFGFFEAIPAPWWRRFLKISFLVSGGCLLFNRAVRINCLIIGCVFLGAALSSRIYYRNAKVFVGVIMLLAGLQDKDRPPLLIWWQLAIVYLGAGINKLVEADWRSGQYFDYFLTEVYSSRIYAIGASLLPGSWFAFALCWWVIAAELAAGALFLRRRSHGHAVWLAATVHMGAAILVVGDYGVFFVAVLASYLSTYDWPQDATVVLGPKTAWAPVARIWRWFDPDTDIHWRQAPSADKLRVLTSGREFVGFQAAWRLISWSPAAYFLLVVLLTVPRGLGRVIAVQSVGATGAVILAATLFRWAGRARRRTRQINKEGNRSPRSG
jgi:hypothetical protein